MQARQKFFERFFVRGMNIFNDFEARWSHTSVTTKDGEPIAFQLAYSVLRQIKALTPAQRIPAATALVYGMLFRFALPGARCLFVQPNTKIPASGGGTRRRRALRPDAHGMAMRCLRSNLEILRRPADTPRRKRHEAGKRPDAANIVNKENDS